MKDMKKFADIIVMGDGDSIEDTRLFLLTLL